MAVSPLLFLHHFLSRVLYQEIFQILFLLRYSFSHSGRGWHRRRPGAACRTGSRRPRRRGGRGPSDDGIDTALFNPDKRSLYREVVRREFGVPQDAPVCLFLGNGFKRKGLDLLLKSLVSLKDKGLYCLVVGGDAAIDRYKGKAKSLRIDDRVIFTGPRKDAARFYATADFFVLPSLQEAFGNAALEAMSCGIPVIVSGRAGASELLKGELERYILNNPHDADEMAAIMMELLDPSKRIILGQIARKIAERYSLEANARDIERLCLQVVRDKINA